MDCLQHGGPVSEKARGHAAGGALAGALAASALMLAYLPVPFLWLALFWGGLLCLAAGRDRHCARRALWVNLAVLVLTLGAVELYFYSRESVTMAGNYTEGYFLEHELLGYYPAPGRKSRAIKYHDEDLVYDVNYRIDSRGLRVSPPAASRPACGSVLFFGGSVTFGEGVEDDQTIAYVTGLRTDGRYAVDNYGFHGYGPHQMLAALQLGVVDKVSSERVSHVIYQGIPAHVARTAGRARWDRHGPRYVLDDSGRPLYAGAFDSAVPHPLRWLLKQLDKSALYRWSGTLQREATREEIDLYTAVVAAARDTIAWKYPAAEFHVLLWGEPGEATYDAILDGFRNADLEVHPVNEILPGYSRKPADYRLSPFDTHPNPRTYEELAEYVSSRILNGGSCRAGAQGAAPELIQFNAY